MHYLYPHLGEPSRLIHVAYRQYGYRLAEIGEYLGLHAVTVSRRLKQAEQSDV
jgi:putative transposase